LTLLQTPLLSSANPVLLLEPSRQALYDLIRGSLAGCWKTLWAQQSRGKTDEKAEFTRSTWA